MVQYKRYIYVRSQLMKRPALSSTWRQKTEKKHKKQKPGSAEKWFGW